MPIQLNRDRSGKNRSPKEKQLVVTISYLIYGSAAISSGGAPPGFLTETIVKGEDTQLKAAVEELLKELEK